MSNSLCNIIYRQQRIADLNNPKVIEAVDQGEPLLVVPIPLSHPEDDDIEALKERIHAIEHPTIVEGTRMAAEKLWRDRRH